MERLKHVAAVGLALAGGVANAYAAPPILGTGEASEKRLEIYGLLQFHYIASTSDGYGDESFIHGFESERVRVGVRGELGMGVSYGVLTQNAAGEVDLLDAFVSVELGEGVSVQVGQMKLPFSREFDTSPTRLLAVDRSVTDNVFNLNRSELVQLTLGDDTTRFRVAFSDGRRALNTGYTDAAEADASVSGRFDFTPAGTLRAFRDMTSFRGQDGGVLLGVGGHAQWGGDTGGTADMDIYQLTADVGVETGGANALVAGHVRWLDMPGAVYTDFGVVVQGGVFVSERFEVFARYDVVLPDGDRPDDEADMFQTVTLGGTWYPVAESHTLKVTGDVSWFPDEESDSLVDPSGRTGVLASADEQLTFRVQVQVQF